MLRAVWGNKEDSKMRQGLTKWAGTAVLAAALAATSALAGGGKPTFTPLGMPGANPGTGTADGSKLVGIIGFGEMFYWTHAEGVVDIGGGCSSGRIAISGDGSTIVGCTVDENGKDVAAKWTGGTSWLSLGAVPGAVPCDFGLSSTWGINYDGSTSVGLSYLPQQCRAHAASWDVAAGGPAADLGSMVPGAYSRANGISGDAHTIVGWQDDEVGQREGAIWVDGVEQWLLTPAGDHVGEIEAANFDATTLVGSGYPFGQQNTAWVWTSRKGFTGITSDPIHPFNVATGASDDGSVVVGVARTYQGDASGWVYNKGKFTYLIDYLSKKKLAPGWSITSVNYVSADGTTLAGQGINPAGQSEGFILENYH